MGTIFSGKNGTVRYWYVYEHGPSPLPRAGSRVGMVCNHGLVNTTGSFFSHSFQLICNVTLTPPHFLQLHRSCCCSQSHGACPQHCGPGGLQGCRAHSSSPSHQPGHGSAWGRASSQASLGCCYSCPVLGAAQMLDLTVLATSMLSPLLIFQRNNLKARARHRQDAPHGLHGCACGSSSFSSSCPCSNADPTAWREGCRFSFSCLCFNSSVFLGLILSRLKNRQDSGVMHFGEVIFFFLFESFVLGNLLKIPNVKFIFTRRVKQKMKESWGTGTDVLFTHSITEIIACDIILYTYETSDFSFTEIQYYAAETIWFSFQQNILLLLNENIYSF